MESQMSDNEKVFDNSQEAIWQREINELDEQLKNPEHYSASDVDFKKLRRKQLQDAIAKRKQKKDLTGGFARGQQNIKDKAALNDMQIAQIAGNRAA